MDQQDLNAAHLHDLEVTVVTEQKEAVALVKACNERHPVLAEVGLLVWRGSPLHVLLHQGAPVSYNVTYFGRRKKNVWEPYANWYTAYTVTSLRRQGLAKHLATIVRAKAREAGCRRLKSLVGTYLGLCLHASFGDQLWGLRDSMEVVVDTPLVALPAYHRRVPPTALTDRPQTVGEVLEVLGGRALRYDAKQGAAPGAATPVE